MRKTKQVHHELPGVEGWRHCGAGARHRHAVCDEAATRGAKRRSAGATCAHNRAVGAYRSLIRPLLFCADAERMHGAAIRAGEIAGSLPLLCAALERRNAPTARSGSARRWCSC
jgi:hypothetical protein